MQNKLLTISETINQAKKSGAYLGHGDPKVHLAYLTKIRLLPQTIRRKIEDQITGYYPDYVVPLLTKIEAMKASGLTYSQIKYQLHNKTQDSPLPSFPPPVSSSNGLAFLLIGLILGFLLATNTTNQSRQAEAAPVPAETATSPLVRVISANNSSSDPIYLIAIPDQNLYKLGKADINLK